MDFKQMTKSFFHQLGISFTELSQSSTFHGIPSFIKSKRKLIKVMWMTLYLAALATSAFLVTKTVLEFLSYEVNTDLTIEYQNPSEFPTISFCNLSPPKEKYTSFDDIKITYKFDESIGNSSDIVTYDERLFGTCFRFNSNESNLKKSMMPGKIYGFTVELFADYSDSYRPSWNDPNQILKKPNRPPMQMGPSSRPSVEPQNKLTFAQPSFSPLPKPDHEIPGFIDNGFRVFIHNYTYEPRPAEGIDVPPGFKTNIVISRHRIAKLRSPYSQCKINSEMQALKSDPTFDATYLNGSMPNGFYSQTRCLDLCFMGIKGSQTLGPPQTPIVRNNYENCKSFCPEECDSLSYTASISLSDFPSEAYFNSRIVQDASFKKILEKSVFWNKSNLKS